MNQKVSILTVEDEEDIRFVLREILKLEGYAVDEAGTGEEALSFLRSGREYSLILLDLRLPDMTGLEFAGRVAEEGLPKSPIVLLSANPAIKQLPVPLDVVGAVGKPFDMDVLLATIERFRKRDQSLSGDQRYSEVS